MNVTADPITNRYIFGDVPPRATLPLKKLGARFDTDLSRWVATPHTVLNDFLKKAGAKTLLPPLDVPARKDVTYHEKTAIQLFPYQETGAAFIRENPNVLLADDMGLGKTFQAIYGTAHLSHVLVVTPAAAKYQWADACRRAGFSAMVIEGRKRAVYVSPRQAQYTIINYDILSDHVQWLNRNGFDGVVLDEGHYIKNRLSKRTKAALSLKAPKRYILTGTPLLNRPDELWSQLAFLNRLPPLYASWAKFTDRYCGAWDAPWGRDTSGATHTKELAAYLNTFTLRRTKEEVLPDLPERRREVLHLPLKSSEYDKAETDFVAWYKGETGKDLTHSDAQLMVRIGQLRQLAEAAKVQWAAHFLQDYDTNKHPIVVFYSFKDTKNALLKAFPNALTIHGAQTSLQKQEAVDAFWKGESPILLAQTESAQTALNLQCSDTTLFLTYPWTPASFRQAEDRIYRIGQKNAVTTYTVEAFSIDMYAAEMLQDKQNVLQNFLSGDIGPIDAHRQLAKKILENRA